MNQKSFVEKRKLFFLMLPFFFLLVLPIVSAVAPVTEVIVSLDTGLNIDFPKFEVIQQNQDFLFYFHVFNISNGIRMDNTTTNCSYELYNHGGEEQFVVDNMEYTDGDWVVNMNGTNFTRIGNYAYLVECHTDNLGGFISFPFEVTPTGRLNIEQFYWIILVISAAILALGFWIKDPWVVIFGTFGLYFIGLYILINGIVGIKDMVTTWAIGLIILAVAAYISIKTAGETIYG